jgi:hypothetical protein
MPKYFARVELHDAKWPADYEELHEALADIGFRPCIKLVGGEFKKLPTGFYFARRLNEDRETVTAKVCEAADDTGYDNEVIVIESKASRSRLSKDCD